MAEEIVILDPLNRYLWALATFIIFLCGIHYISRGRKQEGETERRIMFGFGSFWFGLGAVRIFFYFSDFFIEGAYTGHAFMGNYNNPILPYYEVIVLIGYISSILGMVVFFYEFEKVLNKTKYIFTIFNIASVFMTIFLPFDLSRTYIYILAFFDIFVILLILVFSTKRSSQELQALSSLMVVGILLFLIGWAADASQVRQSGLIPPLIPVLFVIVGAIVAISPTFLDLEIFKKSIVNWTVFIGFTFILVIFVLIAIVGLNWVIITDLGIDGKVIGYSICGVFIFFSAFFAIRDFRLLKPKVIKREEGAQEKKEDILKIFTKPKKITEEEVALYKEKKICLVCKSATGGFNVFICPDCSALYCSKCAKALSDLENVCWNCDAIIDKSKPAKQIKKEEEPVIEESVHKAGKDPKK